MTYATQQERGYIAQLNASEAAASCRAEALADLDLSPLADKLKVVLRAAQDVMESRTASADEKRLAESILDAHGPEDDCFTIRDAVGE